MASLHTATGTPAASHPRAAGVRPKPPTPNPFLRVEPEMPALRPATQSGSAARALEVSVSWGGSVLAVQQLVPPRSYAVGEVGARSGGGVSARGRVDFSLAAEQLGAPRRELVVIKNGAPFAVFGAGERALVLEHGEPVEPSAVEIDCSEVMPGARGIELLSGRVVVVATSGLQFRLAGADETERLPRALLGGSDRSALATLGSAAFVQGLVVAALAYLTPSTADAAMDELNDERLTLMQQYLSASAERNRAEEPAQAEGGSEAGAPAEPSRGPAGKSGERDARRAAGRSAIEGSSPERVLSRAELRREAETFGLVGMLTSLNASSTPSSPWGAELSLGPDALSAHGDMFSRDIGDAFGSGFSLSGPGQGGGGLGRGIGLEGIGGGTCLGLTCLPGGRGGFGGNQEGFGGSRGRIGGQHVAREPRIRMARDVQVSGRLPSEVIQRVVRQNFGRFRQCYELGLRANPNLEGRVTARFVIARDGAVSNVSAGGDLPDAKVSSCVASAFYGLSFPAPENGVVAVTYPILLTPG
jgi:hypothetical protein